jgi:predicted  nucleic acid-binding Zn-ribbon protein
MAALLAPIRADLARLEANVDAIRDDVARLRANVDTINENVETLQGDVGFIRRLAAIVELFLPPLSGSH